MLPVCLLLSGCDGKGNEVETEISVDRTSLEMYVGETVQLTATPAGEPFVWSTKDRAVAQVSTAGLVTATGVGKTDIVLCLGNAQKAIPVTVGKKSTVKFEPDATSCLRNPCTGWGVYCDNFIPNDPVAFYDKLETLGALKDATHMYIRAGWSHFEPQEGVYGWEIDSPLKRMIEETKRRGLKLAFRVYHNNHDYNFQVTPLFVKEAGAEGKTSNTKHWTPYVDDPIFQAKFENFIAAMSAEFDDPEFVDFIDGFGLGIWGEGHNGDYKDPAKKDEVFTWLTNLYATSFTKIMLVINAHKDIGETQVRNVLTNLDYNPRHDAFGARNTLWFGEMEERILKDYFPSRFVIAESCYWLIQNPNGTPGASANWRESIEHTYQDVRNMRANIFDMRTDLEIELIWMAVGKDIVKDFVAKGGYRFYPKEISYPDTTERNKTIIIEHEWCNLGWGVCPNNNSRWNYKYKTAFALLSEEGEVLEIKIDNQGEPSEWLLNRNKKYRFETTFTAPAGNYKLAVAIIDKTKDNRVGIHPSVKDKSLIRDNKWLLVGDINIQEAATSPQ
jgi:hypothetical protein